MLWLSSKQIILGDKTEPIIRWETWYRTPAGLVVSLDDALTLATRNQWPETNIRPVAVAIGTTLYEEAPNQ